MSISHGAFDLDNRDLQRELAIFRGNAKLEAKLRDECVALQRAWDQYQLILKLIIHGTSTTKNERDSTILTRPKVS
jgi:hypothetical protein